MKHRLRLVGFAFVAALVAFLFAMPFIRQDRCLDAGGRFHRDTLSCELPAAP